MDKLSRGKLRKSDCYLMCGLCLSYILLAYVSWVYARELIIILLLGWCFFVLLVLSITSARRIMTLLKELQQKQTKDYRQLQSLFSLFNSVSFQAPLPVMRGWSVMPDFCNVLLSLIQENKPQVIFEAGSGISTVVSGTYLRQSGINASIYSIEHDETFSKVSQSYIRQHQLNNIVNLSVAKLKHVTLNDHDYVWYDMESVDLPNKLDLIVVDGPPSNSHKDARYPALPLLADKMSKRAAILMDDGRREKRIAMQWVREYPEFWMEEIPTERGTIILRNYRPE